METSTYEFLDSNSSFDLENFDILDCLYSGNSDSSPSTSDTLSPSLPEINHIPLFDSIVKEETINENQSGYSISKPISKKKRKASATKEEKKTIVTIDRDILINMTLEEFEKKIETLIKGRSLTKEESNDIKRQRRLVKNRHSAMASRERKKEEFLVLKQENEQLRSEVSRLKSIIDYLKVGNIPTTESLAPYLMIFGLLFSIIFLSQSSSLLQTSSETQSVTPAKALNTKIINNHGNAHSYSGSSTLGKKLMSFNETSDVDNNHELLSSNNSYNYDVVTSNISVFTPNMQESTVDNNNIHSDNYEQVIVM